MKKTKKLLALALMMAFSCMAMPAMAAGDEGEGIMPQGRVTQCPECHGNAVEETDERQGPQMEKDCTKCGEDVSIVNQQKSVDKLPRLWYSNSCRCSPVWWNW